MSSGPYNSIGVEKMAQCLKQNCPVPYSGMSGTCTRNRSCRNIIALSTYDTYNGTEAAAFGLEDVIEKCCDTEYPSYLSEQW